MCFLFLSFYVAGNSISNLRPPKCNPCVAGCVVTVMFLFSHYLGFDFLRFIGLKNSTGVNDTTVRNSRELQEDESPSATNNAQQHNELSIVLWVLCFFAVAFAIKWFFKVGIFHWAIGHVVKLSSLLHGLLNRGRNEL